MYIALEGIDTAGKSTQITLLKEIFKNAIFTFEPGATPLGQQIREILLTTEILSSKAEMLLFLADRAEHYASVIAPNVDKLLISDRSLISGIAYAKGFDFQLLESFNAFVMDNMLPNKAILLEVDKQTLEYRLSQKGKDKIEQRGIAYLLELQERLKETMLHLNVESLSINASLPRDSITTQIVEFINS
ncbi:dTMP kinase [Helicobacter sp. MIT 11-5569]|uniref:dTMP kinase n=1 Tax=Helicobacter sp. MIT 11-5569 TaxID=1548151 RepID=UPI00051F9968|nr:dTMP kinase [Helicobacter sp. MIT 11-5569]TLD82390.1 dTMP kinase [Helicobacter sp. MIT 11-5569]